MDTASFSLPVSIPNPITFKYKITVSHITGFMLIYAIMMTDMHHHTKFTFHVPEGCQGVILILLIYSFPA
jgi:hypothetical protein